ncbi:hypothetical protein Btru_026734, partial [Bulinus truncatus]
CDIGYYGTNCTSPCPTNCKTGECDVQSGQCIEGCEAGYDGDIYENENRPEGQSELSFAHGLAVGAAAVVLITVVFVIVYRLQNQKIQELTSQHKENLYNKPKVPHEEFSLYEGLNPDINMKENVSCDVDYDDTDCSTPCTTNCKTGECDVQSGQCTGGCEDGYVGDKCENACDVDYDDTDCSTPCTTNCKTGECYEQSGQCIGGCEDGYVGDKCENACDVDYDDTDCSTPCTTNCKTGECYEQSGQCIGGCEDGYVGDKCENACDVDYDDTDCSTPCTTNCKTGECYEQSGQCIGGCEDGYVGDKCENACDVDYDDTDCSTPCTTNCKTGECYEQSGQCIGGCEDGYVGDKCENACDVDYDDTDCSTPCTTNCKTGECYEQSGQCIGGCEDGYVGDKCENACDVDYDDTDCSTPCTTNCKTGECYEQSGQCIGGCEDGYVGDKCENACDVDYDDTDCSTPCTTNCKTGECYEQSGQCIGGCEDGYVGDKCENACSSGFYGENCKETCSKQCKSESCDTKTGKCHDGCKTGYEGDKCDRPCSSGYHGENCNERCSINCKSERCDSKSGICHDGCKSGYVGDKCDGPCSLGSYGRNCVNNCSNNCMTKGCDSQTGYCDGGCKDGFMGNACQESCSKGHYGTNCSRYCSDLCVNQTCDRSTGRCFACLPGFKGTFCDSYNSPEEQCEPSFAHGLAVGAAAVVLLAVVFVLVYRREYQKIHELISQHKDNVYNTHNVPHEEFSLYEGLNPDIKMKENVMEHFVFHFEIRHKLNNLVFNRLHTAVSVMLYISFLIIYFFSRNSAAQIDESCKDKTKCEYQCHCDRRCLDSSGLCQPSDKCSMGWFGLRCQYKDLMTLDGAILTGSPRQQLNYINDNNGETCVTSVISVTVTWKTEYHLTWTRLVFRDTIPVIKLNMLYITQQAKTHVPCKHQRLYIVDTKTLDIRCLDNVATSSMIIEGTLTDLCSMYISGGRNVAYRQEAKLSTTYEAFGGDLAVDGNADSRFSHQSCAHSGADEDSPKLTITLQKSALIHRVVLYNRDAYRDRLRSFYLEIFNSTQQKTFEYQDRSTVDQAVYDVNVNNSLAKQVVVSVKNKAHYDKITFLTICEMEVYGECPPGKWGLTCSNDCPEHCARYCHIDDGSCNVSCVGSNDPPQCATECIKGTWGVNCEQNCSNCFNISCDRHTGQCDDGCLGFSDPPVCNKTCLHGTYGRNCSQNCSLRCLNGSCHHVTGYCGGCVDNMYWDFCES